MRFLLDAEQREFARTLDALLTAADTPAVARAWARGDHAPGRALWHRLAEAGVFALAVPEEFDGAGLLPLELTLAVEALGHHAVPGPAVETIASAVLLAALAGEAPDATRATDAPGGADSGTNGAVEAAKAWLPRLASGAALATLRADNGYALDADVADAVLVLSGTASPAGRVGRTDLAGADGSAGRWGGALAGVATPGSSVGEAGGRVAAVPAAPAEPALWLAAEAGAAVPSHDPARRLFTPAAGGELLAAGLAVAAAAERARQWAALATAAQALGVGRALLERTVEYVRERRQFGAAIGSFQAVKHRLADVLIALEFARPLLHAAALSLEPVDIAMAKVACGEAGYAAARAALQLHGAVGYTEELDLSLWLRKARPLRDAWGTPAACRARILRG